MAQDWLADVRKYDADADENNVAAIVRHCGIALRSRDSSLVSFSDSKETDRVRESFLKKKLALKDDDATLDAAIASVGERMKADRTKNRVTVYYLLTQHFGAFGLFAAAKKAAKKPAKKTAKKPATKAAAKATKEPAKKAVKKPAKKPAKKSSAGAATAAAAAGAVPMAAMSTAATNAKPTPTTAAKAGGAAPAAAGGQASRHDDDFDLIGFGCLALAVILGLVAFAAFASGWLFSGGEEEEHAAPAAVVASAPASTTAPTAAPVVPAGAGVLATQRDERPMLTVYFDTGAAEVTPDFQTVSEGVVSYLEANPDATLAISGYNDPSGNAELNAELSKNRAQNVQAALVAAGVDEARTELVKPDDATTTDVTAEEARRVEVTIAD